jgi:hypothetical protein
LKEICASDPAPSTTSASSMGIVRIFAFFVFTRPSRIDHASLGPARGPSARAVIARSPFSSWSTATTASTSASTRPAARSTRV